MAQDENVPDISLLSVSRANRVDIVSLSEAILWRIVGYLDLRTIARLSRVCRYFLKVTRSDEVWRLVCRALVGPWVYHPAPSSKQTPTSSRLQKPSLPADWTEDPTCYPLCQFALSSAPSPLATQKLFSSWYHFAAHYLIPNFHFLGWHISNKAPDNEIVLITYDIYAGALVCEKATCLNFFRPVRDQPEDATILGLPSWVPINRIHLEADGLQYKVSSGNDSPAPDRTYAFQIFTPEYSFSSLFSISPHRLDGPSSNHQLPRKTYAWEDFLLTKNIVQIRHAEKIIAPRSDIRLRLVAKEIPKDLLTNPGDFSKQLLSFTFSRGPDRRNFFPIDGPLVAHHDQPKDLVDGLWVGVNCCCSMDQRQIEFGKIVVEKQSNSHRQLRFLRLTGGRPEFIWHVGIHHGKPIPAIRLEAALSVDFGFSSVDGRWLKGKGQGKDVKVNSWQDIEAQFINDPAVEGSDGEFNESNINQIRVKWVTEEKVTSYFRVQFVS